jgi:hypothetical protein
MANVSANPWSFTSADASVFTASSASETGNLATYTTSAPHGFAVGNKVAVAGMLPTGYNQLVTVYTVPTSETFTAYLTNQNNGLPLFGLGASTQGGLCGIPAYIYMVRGEQIVWQNPGASQTLVVTDVLGNPVWEASTGTGDNIPNAFTYSKPYWIRGLWIQQLTAGVLTATIN